MREKEFNLLDEPWIRVLLPDCTVREVSLPDALLHAQEYTDLAGEMPVQDTAVLRLLLAVLHSVFGEQVSEDETDSTDDALDLWENLWTEKRFPEKPLRDYFAKWHERFWLFHPERPFWQVPQAKSGTEYTAAKLNGELLESSNKTRLFTTFSGTGKTEMTYSQAARWLLYINGYDDTSAKPKGKTDEGEKLPSPGAGWLGKLGLIQVQGKNLFETLMLNFILLKDGKELWEAPKPCWELDVPHSAERTEIALPNNQAELLTLQSRRLLLQRDGDKVTGYTLLGGDFFEKVDAFSEQMTVWREIPAKKNSPIHHQPKRHDPTRQFWREFPTVFFRQPNLQLPGVVYWIAELQNTSILDRKSIIHFRITGMEYGDKDFFVTDAFSDSISFHMGLLDRMADKWQRNITIEIDCCEKLADQVGFLAKNLALASGGNGEAESKKAKEQFYFQLDQPFREWLYKLDPDWDDEESEESLKDWQNQAKKIARRLGEQMVLEAGVTAFVGRTVEVKKKNGKKDEKEKRYYCAPKAYNSFLYWVNAIYGKGETKNDGSNGSGTGKKPGPAEN